MHVALVAAAFALQVGGRGISVPPSLGGAVTGSDAFKTRVVTAERKFFDAWRAAWQGSERERAAALHQLDIKFPTGGSSVAGRFNPRQVDLICYFDWDMPVSADGHVNFVVLPAQAWGTNPMSRKIGSKKNNRRYVCPNWQPPNDYYMPTPELPDERLGIDGALQPDRRQSLQKQRYQVIIEVDAAAQRNPFENFYIGQLVRLYVDNQMLDEALRAARGCRADRWWCAALTGFVYHRRGETAKADESFALTARALPASERCKWTDLLVLLDGDARWTYSQLNCAERDTVGPVIWWLADPLWSVPGNDRRVEQYAREVTIQLHAATGRDERYNWMPEGGGDALAEMVRRYGWPSYTYAGYQAAPLRWPPPPPPTWGVNLLYEPKPKGPPIRTPDVEARSLGGLNTTYEYAIGRLHLLPSWSMVTHPFSMKRSDWSIRGSGGDWDESFNWWPQEHYAPLHPLADINDDQHAFLRRQDTTLLAYATNLSQVELARRVDDSVTVDLIVSTGPDAISLIDERHVTAIDRVALLGPVPPGPSLVSAEVPWDADGHYGARARFAITPPPPLSAMARGTVAISEPVLLVVPPDAPALPNMTDSAIAMMRGSTTISAGTAALGVYWETYGYTERDSVEIAVTVQRTSALNLLHNLGVITGVTGNPNAPVSVSWKEPQRGHDARSVSGAVPVQMRSVILNIASLTPGDYTLEISVKKPGKDAVKSNREFVLR